jgi:hemoglobin
MTQRSPGTEGILAKPDGISEEGIARLIEAFYKRVRADPQLGPIFEGAIAGDWEPHLATMRAFWSSVMLGSRRYGGNPVGVHLNVAGMEPRLFERWLRLFGETCDDLFDEPTSAALRDRAERIAESLKLALFYRPDRPWPTGP